MAGHLLSRDSSGDFGSHAGLVATAEHSQYRLSCDAIGHVRVHVYPATCLDVHHRPFICMHCVVSAYLPSALVLCDRRNICLCSPVDLDNTSMPVMCSPVQRLRFQCRHSLALSVDEWSGSRLPSSATCVEMRHWTYCDKSYIQRKQANSAPQSTFRPHITVQHTLLLRNSFADTMHTSHRKAACGDIRLLLQHLIAVSTGCTDKCKHHKPHTKCCNDMPPDFSSKESSNVSGTAMDTS